MATTRIDVKPAVLHWVQEASNGTLNEAWTNKIDKWLKNESKPTLNQLKDLSKKAQIPFGYFFLDNTPKEDLPLLKFRTINNIEIDRPSRNLVDTIHSMELKQSWLSEERQKNGYPSSFFSLYFCHSVVNKGSGNIMTSLIRLIYFSVLGFKNWR